MKNADIYQLLKSDLKSYYKGRDIRYMFLHGGCYCFAQILQLLLEDATVMWKRKIMHCGIYFNHGLYDITGKISAKGYVIASDKDKLYMRKHFIPVFDVLQLEQHIYGQMEQEERECLRRNSTFLVKH